MPSCANSVPVKNLGLIGRWTSVVGGAMLLAYGVKKRSAAGTLLAVLGGDLIYRGTTGYSPLYDALGLPPAEELLGKSASIPYRQGIRIEKSITIDKPREEVYSFWRNLSNLPRFMKNLHRVTPLGDKQSHWTAFGPGGKLVEWDAEINHEEPNELIGWRSLTGSDVDSAGSVHFKPAPGGRGGTRRDHRNAFGDFCARHAYVGARPYLRHRRGSIADCNRLRAWLRHASRRSRP